MESISIALISEHLATACVPNAISLNSSKQRRRILVSNLNPKATVEDSIKKFVEDFLFIPSALQSLLAPLYTRIADDESVEDLYEKYDCHAETQEPHLHVDDETYTIWAKESGRTTELHDKQTLLDHHVLHKSTVSLKVLPEKLSDQGGRIFVQTKNGIIPLVAVTPLTKISEIKHRIQTLTSIPASQQLLSSVGRIMHDEFRLKDFEGFHSVYEGSVLDLCKSGDSNMDQAHRRMLVFLKADDHTLTLVVQPSDPVRILMQFVETRIGIPQWKQRLTFSGKLLHEKRTLAEYFIFPESTIIVKTRKSNPVTTLSKTTDVAESEDGHADCLEPPPKPAARKLKLVRTRSGRILESFTIPVLVTDKVSDLKKKIKIYLQPMIERPRLSSSCASSVLQVPSASTTNSQKPPIPLSLNSNKSADPFMLPETQTSQPSRSPFVQSPPLSRSSSVTSPSPTCQSLSYSSPQEIEESFSTPLTNLEPPKTPSSKASESVKSFIARKLHFGSPSGLGKSHSQSSSNLRQPFTPLKRFFPQTKQSSENQIPIQQSLQKAVNSGVYHDSENYRENEAHSSSQRNGNGSEKKRTISSWLSEKMPNVKGHSKAVSTDK